MIGFDVSAVRSIMFTFAVYIGIGTPPILISQTKQLVCQYSFLSAGKTLPISMLAYTVCVHNRPILGRFSALCHSFFLQFLVPLDKRLDFVATNSCFHLQVTFLSP